MNEKEKEEALKKETLEKEEALKKEKEEALKKETLELQRKKIYEADMLNYLSNFKELLKLKKTDTPAKISVTPEIFCIVENSKLTFQTTQKNDKTKTDLKSFDFSKFYANKIPSIKTKYSLFTRFLQELQTCDKINVFDYIPEKETAKTDEEFITKTKKLFNFDTISKKLA